MDLKALLVLVMLLNTILLISAEDTTNKDSNEKIVQEDGKSTTDAIDESKYGRGGGFRGRGGFGGGRGGWRGGYGGGWRGGYGGGWRGGYGGWRGGYGGYCPYGCCYWGYYGGCLRCCYYPGESTEASIDAKPYN